MLVQTVPVRIGGAIDGPHVGRHVAARDGGRRAFNLT